MKEGDFSLRIENEQQSPDPAEGTNIDSDAGPHRKLRKRPDRLAQRIRDASKKSHHDEEEAPNDPVLEQRHLQEARKFLTYVDSNLDTILTNAGLGDSGATVECRLVRLQKDKSYAIEIDITDAALAEGFSVQSAADKIKSKIENSPENHDAISVSVRINGITKPVSDEVTTGLNPNDDPDTKNNPPDLDSKRQRARKSLQDAIVAATGLPMSDTKPDVENKDALSALARVKKDRISSRPNTITIARSRAREIISERNEARRRAARAEQELASLAVARVSESAQLSMHEQRAQDLEKQIDALRTRIDQEQRIAADQLGAERSATTTKITQLEMELAERQRDLDFQVTEKNATIANLQKLHGENEAIIESLRNQIAHLQDTVDDTSAGNMSFQRELADRDTRLQRIHKQLMESQREAQQLLLDKQALTSALGDHARITTEHARLTKAIQDSEQRFATSAAELRRALELQSGTQVELTTARERATSTEKTISGLRTELDEARAALRSSEKSRVDVVQILGALERLIIHPGLSTKESRNQLIALRALGNVWPELIKAARSGNISAVQSMLEKAESTQTQS